MTTNPTTAWRSEEAHIWKCLIEGAGKQLWILYEILSKRKEKRTKQGGYAV